MASPTSPVTASVTLPRGRCAPAPVERSAWAPDGGTADDAVAFAAGGGADAGARAHADAGTGVDADADAGAGGDTDAGAGANADADDGADAGAGADADARAGTNADDAAGVDAGAGAGANADAAAAVADVDAADPGADADAGAGANAAAGAEAAAEAGAVESGPPDAEDVAAGDARGPLSGEDASVQRDDAGASAVPASGVAARPVVTELRLSAFKSHRGAVFRLGPVTVLAGPGGSGKSSVLEALLLLARLAAGEELAAAIADTVAGGAGACVPEGSPADDLGRRGFRLGCTADGPLGPVRLDLAVQTVPALRIVGERLTGSGLTLLSTALRDPSRSSVQAAWHTAGSVPVTRAPLPDNLLSTALLPLRVAGTTDGQRLVLACAEQLLIALRAVFPVSPVPAAMRAPSRVADGMLRPSCDNLSAVLHRTQGECRTRHAALLAAARVACAGAVERLVVLEPPPDGAPEDGSPGAPGAPGTAAVGAATPAGPAAARAVGQAVGPGRAAGASGRCPGAGRRDAPAAEGRIGAGGEPAGKGVMAALDRGPSGITPIDRLGDSELRFLALALVLLTGPGVLDMDQSGEVPAALRVMTVAVDGLDTGLDGVQTAALLSLAVRAAEHGHVRVLGTAHDADLVRADGVSVVPLGGRRRHGTPVG